MTSISNLAMANLRRRPPGTLPPVVLKFDASSLPVCLVTLKGEGLSETVLRDNAQYSVRNQVANVAGASAASIAPPSSAQARYDLGLSSIVELSQAELAKTEAEIQRASARYDYETQRATLSYQIGDLR